MESSRTQPAEPPARRPRVPLRQRLARLDPQEPTTRGIVASVLVLLMVAVAVVIGWQAWQLSDYSARTDRRAAAVAAAKDAAVNLLSYDYKTIDRDQKRVIDRSTGDFKDDYLAGQGQIKSQATQLKGSSAAQILDTALVSSDHDSATVLVAADATAKSTQNAKGVTRHLRMQLQLAYQNGRWLLAGLQWVG